jgi:hypothetical protein
METLDPFSKITLDKFLHLENDHSQRLSTADGIQIDPSDEQTQNASVPITESLDPLSNVTLNNLGQPQKNFLQRL